MSGGSPAFMPPDWVQKQWETDLIINARGVAVDLELVTGALYLGDTVRQNLTAEAVRLSGLSNPTAWPSSPHGSRRRLVRSWPI